MRISTTLLTTIIIAGLIAACSPKKDGPAAPAPVVRPALVALEKVPFTAPADSMVSAARMRTKARMISMFTAMARGLLRMLESMATPCSVKTSGR